MKPSPRPVPARLPATPVAPATPAGMPGAEALVAAVEAALQDLGVALRQRDSTAIEARAQELQRSLERAVSALAAPARAPSAGPAAAALPRLTPAQRERLQQARHLAIAQREALSRATGSLDRALHALLPREAAPVYGWRAQGTRLGA